MAFGEAADKPARLGRFRLAAGYLLLAVGAAAGIAVPLINPGQIGEAGSAGSALILVIAVALLGPRWLSAMTTLACPAPFRGGAGGFLSTASMRARSRRMSLAATPLIIAVALSAVQVFTTTTMVAAARQQASSGLTADYVLTGTGSGLAPGIAGAVRGVRGASVVTPVARTQVLASFVTATAARAREFELLRLIGATRRQVRAMMRRETLILVAVAVIVGSLVALPPLIGVSAGMTRHLVPTIPPLEYLAIVAVVTALGWGSIMLPARLAMRSRTAGVLNSREG